MKESCPLNIKSLSPALLWSSNGENTKKREVGGIKKNIENTDRDHNRKKISKKLSHWG